MIAQGNIERGSPPTETGAYDAELLDRQRSGGGFLGIMLFPLISIAAIAFAAYELMR